MSEKEPIVKYSWEDIKFTIGFEDRNKQPIDAETKKFKFIYKDEAAPEATEDGMETSTVPMDYGETVNGLIRRKYTLSEELAILRQRDTKAEEFEAYNAYAESCKEEARLLIEKQKH